MATTASEIQRTYAAMARDPLLFGKLIDSNDYFCNAFGPVHRCLIEDLNSATKKEKIIVVEIPRGFAKTMIASTINPLHRCIFPRNNRRIEYVIVSSFSNEKAKQIIGDYKNIILGDKFQAYFPGTKFIVNTQDEIEVENKTLGFRFLIMGRGRSSQMAGLRYGSARPQIYIGDDLENPEEAYNQAIVDANERYINEVIQFGLDPDIGYTVLIGTPFAFDCTTQRFMKYPRNVKVIKYPALVNDALVPGMSKRLGLPEGHSIWEARFPTAELLQARDDNVANGTIESWMRQVMLDPRSEGAVRIPIEKIKRATVDNLFDEYGEARLPINVFIMSDYAYSRSVWADESAIVVWAIDNDSNYYMLHSDKGKWGDIGTTDRIVDLAIKYKKHLKLVGVESRGMGFIENRLNIVKRSNNLAFGMVELKPKNRSKAERIKAIISLFDDGRVVFIGPHNKMEAEMARFRGEEMRHGDDLMDAAAYILDVGFKPIMEETPEDKAKRENHKAFAQWSAAYDKQTEEGRSNRGVHASTRMLDSDW